MATLAGPNRRSPGFSHHHSSRRGSLWNTSQVRSRIWPLRSCVSAITQAFPSHRTVYLVCSDGLAPWSSLGSTVFRIRNSDAVSCKISTSLGSSSVDGSLLSDSHASHSASKSHNASSGSDNTLCEPGASHEGAPQWTWAPLREPPCSLARTVLMRSWTWATRSRPTRRSPGASPHSSTRSGSRATRIRSSSSCRRLVVSARQ
mmetsp:Transcript_30569/g.87321  ORF Transcript_30569/g.87321 Transcript_30569/m.87321 type:complete len:203 (+) Transcript_30569:1369-1977(+)